jgi:Flp pilus assembly protein TadG
MSRSGTRGQTLAEFALVFPIFIMLLFGLLDLGRYVFVANGVNQVAREAARVGSVAGWIETCTGATATRDSCIKQVAEARLAAARPTSTTGQCFRTVNASGVPVNPTPNANTCSPGDILRVRVTVADFKLLTPVISNLVGPTIVEGVADVAVNN